MNPIRSNSALVLLMPLAACALFVQACADSHALESPADPFEGAWEAVVTLRDCGTGATLGTFRGAQVLHRGGTLVDTNASPPGSRGPGMGIWWRNNDGSYAAKFRFYRYNNDGTLAGTNVVTSTRTLSADFNSYSGDTRGEVRDLSGNVIATNCVSDMGTRFR